MARQDLELFLGAIQQGSQSYMQGRALKLQEQQKEINSRMASLQVAQSMQGLTKIPDPKVRVAAADMLAPQLGFDVKDPTWASFRAALASDNPDVSDAAMAAATELGLSQGSMQAFGKFAKTDPAGALSAILKIGEAKQQQAKNTATAQADSARLAFDKERSTTQLGQGQQEIDLAKQAEARKQAEFDWEKTHGSKGGGGARKQITDFTDASGNPVFMDNAGNVYDVSGNIIDPLTGQSHGPPTAPDAAAPTEGGIRRLEKPTEGELKNRGYVKRMELGNQNLEGFLDKNPKYLNEWGSRLDKFLMTDPSVAKGMGAGAAAGGAGGSMIGLRSGAGVGGSILGGVGGAAGGALAGGAAALLAPLLKTDEGRRFQAAAAPFVNSALRKDTGAAISDAEWEFAFAEWLPAPGDPEDVKETKKQNRAAALEAAKIGANYKTSRGLPVEGMSGVEAAAPPAAPPQPTAPQADITQAEYEALPRGGTFWWKGRQLTKQ